ncbi:MAG: hypothetical protein ACE37F_09300 [Nannocystaceae bacterium]|nr:hypothetical protein [bacterium]
MARTTLPSLALGAAAAALALAPSTADAKPARSGIQVEGLIGGSNCIPGRADCTPDSDTLNGTTRGAVGGGVLLGWRALRWMTLGVAYRGGMFRPDYELQFDNAYARGSQHSVFAVARPTIPIWRFDLGLNVAPGYSRQIFRYEGGDQDFTQGFAFMTGPVVDVYLTQRFFLGFEADFIFNAHRDVCNVRGSSTECVRYEERYPNPVHQAIYGLHIGFNS